MYSSYKMLVYGLLFIFIGTIQASLNGRIIGGSIVEIKNYPYQISLQQNGRHICGGSIVTDKFIVTAAHCVEGTIAANLKVRAGSSYYAKGGQVLPVLKIYSHEKYDGLDYDIAILELSGKIQFGLAQPVRVADVGSVLKEGDIAVVSGWGHTEQGGKSEQLKALKVPIIGAKKCQECYPKFNITARMTCAGYLEGGKDACQGDSGGPLVLENKLVGVVSWGLKCAQPNQPGVYANVAQLREFISRIVGIRRFLL